MAIKGTVTYKDLKANFSTMRFKPAAGKALADVNTLAVILDTYTACDRRAHAFQERTYAAATGTGNKDIKGIVTVADADGEVHKWALPGYNGDTVQDNDGEIMDPTPLAAIVAGIAALTGETYTILRSPVIQTR